MPPPACALTPRLPTSLAMAAALRSEATMGGKSPKSKERGQKQKKGARGAGAAAAKAKSPSTGPAAARGAEPRWTGTARAAAGAAAATASVPSGFPPGTPGAGSRLLVVLSEPPPAAVDDGPHGCRLEHRGR